MKCRACGLPSEKVYCDNLCRYHELPFRGWDGEGITPPGSLAHKFNILATNNETPLIVDEEISTEEAFHYLTLKREPCINVWYFFDYDVNCILKNIPLYPYLEELARTNETFWRGWRIKYVPTKIFSIKRGLKHFTSYDVYGFFQKSFIKACKSFGLDTQEIERGKSDRANFHLWKVSEVVAYNNCELVLLCELMTQVRKRLAYHAPRKSWYGPGAISSNWLLKTVKLNPKEHRNFPSEMNEAIMRSYFGGRIDVNTLGEVNCHAYDIASAYPYAMTQIYEIERWEYSNYADETEPMGLYHIRWTTPRYTRWGPFPWRSSEGRILYPSSGEGWYYGVEVLAAERCFPGEIERIGAWIPIKRLCPPVRHLRHGSTACDGYIYPLRKYIQSAYDARRKLKAKSDPSELAYKLILNSIYGKFAQKRTTKNEPRYQNYVWAGFITAYCRAMLLDVIRICPESVVATATDSIFCLEPIIPRKEDSELGHWQYEGFAPTLFVMPGIYARIKSDVVEKYRQRGFPLPINYGSLLRSWGCDTLLNTEGADKAEVQLKRFITFRQAVAQHRKEWGYFEEEEKGLENVAIRGFSKRFPDPLQILEEHWLTRNMLTVPAPYGEIYSHEYVIPTFEEEVERDSLELL